MMNKPKVSIVIPVYNVEKYLAECLDSLINQTLSEIEIICVNDGSTDGSLNILHEYEVKDSRITIIDKPNAGYGHTMNLGMDTAKGDYIGIVESDDVIKLDMYEKLYACAKKNDLDWVKSDFYRYTHREDTSIKLDRVYLCPSPEYYNKVFVPNDFIECYGFTMHTWCGIYKTSFIRSNNIRHNETPGASFQDTGFFFQTFAWAKKAYFMDEAFYWYRCDNPGSSVKSKTKVYCIKEEYEFVMDFLNNNPEIKNKVIGMYWSVRCGSYLRTLKRIASEYKKEFIYHFNDVFKMANARKELSWDVFPDGYAYELKQILDNPDKYYTKMIKMQNSKTFFFQKVHSGFNRFKCCMKDHGLAYTVKLLGKKIYDQVKPPSWTYRSAIKAHIKANGRKLLKKIGMPNKEMRAIQRLHNIHSGKRCFITCTGPSLRIEDLEKLESEYTIGVNTIFLAFSQTKWRPTYYAIVDAYIADKYQKNYDLDFESFSTDDVFLNSYVKHKKSSKIHNCHIDFKNHTKKNLKKNQIFIDEDISTHIFDCFTVTNMAINIAIYLGFKDIYILGADCNFEGEKIHFIPNQFDPTQPKKDRFKVSVSRSISGYQALKNFAHSKNINIYNATRGGHLEVFERVDFDSLFTAPATVNKYSEFLSEIKRNSNGREIVIWGKAGNQEFNDASLSTLGGTLRNVFLTEKLCDGIKTLHMPKISNRSDKYFIINTEDIPLPEKIEILKKYGYETSSSFYCHDTISISGIKNYNDEFGNIIRNCPANCTVKLYGRNSSVIFEKNFKPGKPLLLSIDNDVKIEIGEGVSIGGFIDCKDNSCLIIEKNTDFRGTTKILVAHDGKLHISSDCNSGSGNDIRCHAGYEIYIGKNCLFSSAISIIAGSGHSIYDIETGENLYELEKMPEKQKKIYIGSHVWLGYGVTILNGAHIESGCMVGTKSLVKAKCPNNCMIVGIPSKIIKKNIAWSRNPFETNVNSIPLEFRIATENTPKINYLRK